MYSFDLSALYIFDPSILFHSSGAVEPLTYQCGLRPGSRVLEGLKLSKVAPDSAGSRSWPTLAPPGKLSAHLKGHTTTHASKKGLGNLCTKVSQKVLDNVSKKGS